MRGNDWLVKLWRKSSKSNRWLSLAFLVLLGICLVGIYWFNAVYQDTSRTFWAMVGNNLTTASVVKKTSQQNQSVVVDSYNQLTFNGRPVLLSLRQVTDSSTKPNSKLTLEAIGTEKADFQRYSEIVRPSPNGKLIDYSQVYGIWLKTSTEDRPATLLVNSLFGPVIFGQLNYAQRMQLEEMLRKAYQPTYAGRTNIDGRLVYKYSVKVNMRAYTKVVQRYIDLIGFKGNSVSPESIPKDKSSNLTMNVDVKSRYLVKIVNNSNAGAKEDIMSYGIRKEVLPPSRISTVADLQKAIQSASQ